MMRTRAPRARGFQYWGDRTLSLGCASCAFAPACGGLRVSGAIFDCLQFCTCPDPERCDLVCPRSPYRLAARVQEVDGLSLANLPRFEFVPTCLPGGSVPLLYGGSRRTRALTHPAVALSLHALVDRLSGLPKVVERAALAERFHFQPTAAIVLSGTDVDGSLERWWSIRDRGPLFAALRNIAPVLVTSPNYSLPANVPRHDNLHSVKRIGISCVEMGAAGLPVALHVNARTDRDWEAWIGFVADRPEITSIAFEFGTGAAGQRREWYVQKLVELSERSGHRLNLVVRGGTGVLATLAASFESVTYIDTDSYVKTTKRQRFDRRTDSWLPSRTAPTENLDHLLDNNVREVARKVERLTGQRLLADDPYHEAWQPSLLPKLRSVERRPEPADR